MTDEIGATAFEAAPGTQIAGYQVEAEIGRGGMAIVYRALDGKLGRPVALKILAPRLAEDESFRRRFMHESRAAAAVDHPNIVPVFEAGEAGGCLFIAMRYVGTGDVRSLLERHGRLPVRRVIAIVSQVASALDVAHSRGLIHRDVKPANMLLAESSDGRSDHVYLSDFGLSKLTLAPSGLTSTGQFMGTLDYVAPEQIEGKGVDGRADQYSLACTTVEMLTGAPPFRRAENMALMWAQLSEPPPRLTERCPDLPPGIDEVIIKALAKSPGDRYQGCLEFAAALQAAAAAQPGAGAWAASLGQVRTPTEHAYLPGSRQTALDAAGRGAVEPVQGGVPPASQAGFPAAAAGASAVAGAAALAGAADALDLPRGPGTASPAGPPVSGFAAAPVPAAPAGPADLAGYPAGSALPGSALPGSALPGSALPGSALPGSALPGSLAPGSVVPESPPAGTAWPRSAWPESDLPPAPDDWFRPPSSAGHAGSAASAASPAPVDSRWISQGPAVPMPRAPGTSRPPRRSRAGLVIAIVLLVVVCLGAAAYLVHRHRVAIRTAPPAQTVPATSPATATSQAPPLATSPARVVAAYFRAINHHRYARAWALGGRNAGETYSRFVSGYSNTKHDAVQIISVNGNLVFARLVATQTDGSLQTYQGTYTVTGGQISQFNIHRLS